MLKNLYDNFCYGHIDGFELKKSFKVLILLIQEGTTVEFRTCLATDSIFF